MEIQEIFWKINVLGYKSLDLKKLSKQFCNPDLGYEQTQIKIY